MLEDEGRHQVAPVEDGEQGQEGEDREEVALVDARRQDEEGQAEVGALTSRMAARSSRRTSIARPIDEAADEEHRADDDTGHGP